MMRIAVDATTQAVAEPVVNSRGTGTMSGRRGVTTLEQWIQLFQDYAHMRGRLRQWPVSL